MQLPRPSFSILLLVFSSSVFRTTLALSPFSPAFNAAVASRNIPLSQRSALQDHPSLRKRIGADLEEGWHMSIDNYELFIPLGFAAAEMIRFYTNLLTMSRRRANDGDPALSNFHMVVGSLKIAFGSTDPIAWDWVTRFTEELLEFTRRGFVGAYFIRYWHDDGRIVSVKMAFEDETMHRLATMPIPPNN